MIYFIYGGSASGKSEYAENLLLSLSGNDLRFYIATMKAFGAEGAARVKRHQRLRAGKGFHTIECPVDIGQAISIVRGNRKDDGTKMDAAILIECISNLVANEMFESDNGEEHLVDRITAQLAQLCGQVKNVVIVSNNIFEEATCYEDTTRRYMEYLGQINENIAAFADQVYEVVVGIPIQIK